LPDAATLLAARARHRARRVSSAIAGPRTIEQLHSQLPAADVVLEADVLDRVDEIVRPGVNINPADTSYGEQVLEPALRRR
jgi:aryl-alcohol dehydrogenase-like predicted oxidoreductase